MNIRRKLGILIVFGVPVIVGGGIAYALFGGMVPVMIWEVILLLLAGGLISK